MSTRKDAARPFGLGTFFVVDGTGLEQHGHAAGGATNTPVGCLLVRGSQRLGMSTKKDAARPFESGLFVLVGGTGREPEQAKAGYHRGDGILPFVLIRFISRSQHPLQYSLRENFP